VSGILLAGPTGQVGSELERALASLGTVTALHRPELDLCNPDSIRKAVRGTIPEIIVNAAGYTAVDRAESEPELAMEVNGIAPGVMAEEAKRIGALFTHYSTDYVFDGMHAEPYLEDDEPNPVNVYGRTKLAGERAIAAAGGAYLTLRTSWIYGTRRPNFVLTILKLAGEKPELAVVADQIGSPTWARSLAAATVQILRDAGRARRAPGIYHLSAHGHTSRFDFARRILEMNREISGDAITMPKLHRITAAQFPLPAARPLNAATSKDKVERVFGVRMAHWESDLRAFLLDLATRSNWQRALET
jgi:dTDP-4-dehydrorhamnose reductase